MDSSRLDSLLEKYYSGVSTLDEEAELMALLASDDVPEIYQDDKYLLTGLSKARNDTVEPPEGLEGSIMEHIGALENKGRGSRGRSRTVFYSVAVAASLAVLAVSYFMFSSGRQPADSFTDPMLAYQQAKEVLVLMSQGINTGKTMMSDLGYVDMAAEKMNIITSAKKEAQEKLMPIGYLERGLKLIDPLTGNQQNKQTSK